MKKKKKEQNLISLRRRKIIRRRFLMGLRFLLILIFFAAAVWGLNYFYNSDYFRIKELKLNGLGHYTREDIESKTGNLIGSNIFEVDKKGIEDMLTAEMTWISSTDLRKVFPDKIIIELAERKPYVKVYSKGVTYLLDPEGMVLEKISSETAGLYEDLLLIRNVLKYGVEPGEKIAKKNLLSCATIYAAMDEEIRGKIKEAGIDDDCDGSIYFTTFEGQEIIFGDSEDIVKKIQILKELLKEKTSYNIIDIRSTENPVVK
ncbi:MAG: FtsQ-type POTRA domain-containing protein [Actinobacteria bacterium]|nr:FtsQ-type POTRA domain-containing protein [Actinomycetota bacterium]